MTDEKNNLRKAVETFHKSEVAFLNKVYDGICKFELVQKDNIVPDISMKEITND